jgi:hypothetical protein
LMGNDFHVLSDGLIFVNLELLLIIFETTV